MAVNILLKRSATASKRPVAASMAFGELNLNYDAATGGLYYKDSAGNVVKVGPCQVSATAPNSSPAGSAGNSAGEFWYDSSTDTLKVYNGTTWVEAGGAVDSVSGTAPIQVDNTDPLNPVISVDAATTSAPGVVQLNDTTSSTSTSEALTAAQGKSLQDQIDALVISSNLTFAGTLDTATGNLLTVSSAAAAAGFAIGDPLPAADSSNEDFFVIVEVASSSYTPPGGSPVETHIGDWFLSDGSAWQFLNVGFHPPYASDTTPGVVQLATDAEVQAGVETTHAVTSSGLQSKVSDSVTTASSTTIASSQAVKDAYDTAISANDLANAAFDAAGLAQTDADQALSDAAAAQATADQAVLDAAAAQATADAALPKAGGTMTGDITFSGAGNGIVFQDASTVEAISNSTSLTSSITAASSTAVKAAYDAAVTAAASDPFASSNVLFVNPTIGNDTTAARGTAKPYATLTAALAAASDGDFIYMAPGTYIENPVINKGVTILGSYQDLGTWQGTKIEGNTQLNLSASVTRNCAIYNVYFISTNSTPPFEVLAHATTAGNTIIANSGFTQQITDVNQFAFRTAVATWARAIYTRNCLFDGNVKHNAGTAAGASGYLVMDNTIGAGSSSYYYHILTGTVEFRNPSQALSPIYQTGGVVSTSNVLGFTSNSATTTTIFGGTGFNYKGSAASVGTGTVYFGAGYNTAGGKVDIGANLVYGWTNLNVTPANLTINVSAVPYTTAVPSAANVVVAQQTRPQYNLLTTTSSVSAANQLATVLDGTTGILYSVTSFDAGTY